MKHTPPRGCFVPISTKHAHRTVPPHLNTCSYYYCIDSRKNDKNKHHVYALVLYGWQSTHAVTNTRLPYIQGPGLSSPGAPTTRYYSTLASQVWPCLVFMIRLTALLHVLICSATSENLSKSPPISSLTAANRVFPSSPFSSTKMCLTRAYRVSPILSSIPLKSKPMAREVGVQMRDRLATSCVAVFEAPFLHMGATGRKAVAPARRQKRLTTVAFMIA